MRPHYTSREMLAQLVGFDTTTQRSNLELIAFIENYLQQWGVDSRRITDPVQEKANLHALIGPEESGGIALSGHSDVVPAIAADWRSDPFILIERDGRLYGRGSADMKGFLAAALAAVPEMTTQPLRKPIHLCISYDEEIGCLGAPALIAALTESGAPRPRLAIIGEPTAMKVVSRHKSIIRMKTEIRGREGHSSDPRCGVNAITIATTVIGEMEAIARDLEQQADPGNHFDPPWTTLHVGVINGGTACNIIPGRCRISWQMRGIPGFDKNQVLDRLNRFCTPLMRSMRQIAPETGIETRVEHEVTALHGTDNDEALRLVCAWAETETSHTVPYMTEAGLFESAGIPAIVCGPGRIEQAHQPDEYIENDQLAAADHFIRRLISSMAS